MLYILVLVLWKIIAYCVYHRTGCSAGWSPKSTSASDAPSTALSLVSLAISLQLGNKGTLGSFVI